MTDKPITAAMLADALGCFHNAALGHAMNEQNAEAYRVCAAISEGLNAIAYRLQEWDEMPERGVAT